MLLIIVTLFNLNVITILTSIIYIIFVIYRYKLNLFVWTGEDHNWSTYYITPTLVVTDDVIGLGWLFFGIALKLTLKIKN
jgi:hypothetical protein